MTKVCEKRIKKLANEGNITVSKYLINRILVGVIGILAVSLYTHKLSPEIYGNYTLSFGMVMIMNSLFVGWIASLSTRYYDKYKGNDTVYFTNTLFQVVVMIFTMLLIIHYLIKHSTLINQSHEIYIWCMIISVAFYSISESNLIAAQFTTFYSFSTLLKSLSNIIIFFILTTYYNLSLRGLYISIIISNLLFSMIVFNKFKIYKKIKYSAISIDLQKKFISYGFPLVGVWGVTWLLNFSDRYIIKLFESSKEVGVYDIAYTITDRSVLIVITAFTMAIYPKLITTWNESGKKKVERLISKSIEQYLILILPAVVGLIAVRKSLFGSVLSVHYLEGNNVILFVSIGLIFHGMTQLLYKLLELKEDTKRVFKLTMIPVGVNIALNLILVPILGYTIAGVTTLIAYLISFILAFVAIRKEFKLTINGVIMVKVLFSCSFMYAILIVKDHYININGIFDLLTSVLVGVVVYVILMFVLTFDRKKIHQEMGSKKKVS